MSRHKTSTKKTPPEIGLHMECTEEDLEPCQIVHYNKAETEYNEIQNKLDNYISKMKAEVIEKGENCLVLQLNVSNSNAIATSTQVPPVTTSGKTTRQTAQNFPQVVSQGIITRSSTNTTGNTYLVMDPRLGLVVGQVPATSVATEPTATSPAKSAAGTRNRQTAGTVMVTTRARSGIKKVTPEADIATSPTTRSRDKTKTQAPVQPPTSPTPQLVQQQVYSPGGSSTTPGNYRVKINAKPVPPPAKPTENNALGGLTAGSKIPWKPNTVDEGGGKGANAADSKEVTFSKMSGKTFPSLVVAARPHLRLKYIPQSNITQERTGLDAKVKGVLMYTPTKFTEWLIQQGLIKSEQTCQFHVHNDLSPVKLKLGMYSDVSKFPYSGGYVWISDCCPSQFVSVFSGSIFEGAPHPPTTLLKLIYHWACQTNVQNVVQWVKVDNLYVKNFFTNMRAVCTQAIHQKQLKMGGPRSKIEVGVISLGTTSQDGNMRQLKVEVLGVMDPETKMIRLRALEPIAEERSFKRRFAKILEPLEDWVHKESTIFTDFTVDKGTLNNMGFRTVYQMAGADPPTKYSNQNVMDYLRRIVPRMFQNTLSLLSRQIIQQFLDELVWREMWGPIPSQAFVNIIAHISEQTKLDVQDNILFRLNKVASNPFKNWTYSVWKAVSASLANTKAQQTPSSELDAGSILKSRGRKRTIDQPVVDLVATSTPAKKPLKLATKDKVKKEEKTKSGEKKKETPEKESSITDEIVAFINDDPSQISLNSYYYGTKEGEEELMASGSFLARCSVCNKRFDDNVLLMKHMILHCQLEPIVTNLNNVHQCSYCFLGFNTASGLNDHVEEFHSVGEKENCRICEERFNDRVELVYHMHRTHVEMELPYECGVCRFRSSSYKILIDHFIQIHQGSEHVLCPFCLKVVTVCHKGRAIATNVRFFETHLEKHNRSSLTKKCQRCKLSFVHGGILEQHLEADHWSFKCEYGIKPILDEGILMPEPSGLIKPISTPKILKNLRAKSGYVCNKFKALEINCSEDDTTCIECEGSLLHNEHFLGNFNCLKCRYATCCERAISEHILIFHESPNQQFSIGKPIMLPDSMYCICGFSSYSGNKLAKHIALCEKKSAYSSEEAATAATLVKDKSPSKQQVPGEPQNVLNMLGLVRKSPEIGIPVNDSPMKDTDVKMVEDTESKFDAPDTSVEEMEKEPVSSKEESNQETVSVEDQKEDTQMESEESEECNAADVAHTEPEVEEGEEEEKLIADVKTEEMCLKEKQDVETSGEKDEISDFKDEKTDSKEQDAEPEIRGNEAEIDLRDDDKMEVEECENGEKGESEEIEMKDSKEEVDAEDNEKEEEVDSNPTMIEEVKTGSEALIPEDRKDSNESKINSDDVPVAPEKVD